MLRLVSCPMSLCRCHDRRPGRAADGSTKIVTEDSQRKSRSSAAMFRFGFMDTTPQSTTPLVAEELVSPETPTLQIIDVPPPPDDNHSPAFVSIAIGGTQLLRIAGEGDLRAHAQTDLIPGVYEGESPRSGLLSPKRTYHSATIPGGLKLWECSVDLATYIAERAACLPLASSAVIEVCEANPLQVDPRVSTM